jgi:hypothetical protein
MLRQPMEQCFLETAAEDDSALQCSTHSEGSEF